MRLTISMVDCTVERSFSKIKNKYTYLIARHHLSSLIVVRFTERNVLRNTSIEKTLPNGFASQ